MNAMRKVSRITAFLPRSVSKDAMEALRSAGIHDVYMAPARSLVINAKKGLLSLLPGKDLIGDTAEMIFFLVNRDMATPLFNLVVNKGHLSIPGMGTIICEDMEIPETDVLYNEMGVQPFEAPEIPVHPHVMTGICCVVERGRGDAVARVALDTGTCAPFIHFGTGTGVRDKMGLLRITIPAEKEIIHVFTSGYEGEGLLRLMAEVGELEKPGKGFIQLFPVRKAVVNMKVTRGGQQHAASIEQVIAAIDHIKGSAEWRRRTSGKEKSGARQQEFLLDHEDFIVLCDGGSGTELVKAAMGAGAGGATIATLRHMRPADSPLCGISPLRELCSMVIPKSRREAIWKALDEAGAFTDHCHSQIQIRQAPKALTYQRR